MRRASAAAVSGVSLYGHRLRRRAAGGAVATAETFERRYRWILRIAAAMTFAAIAVPETLRWMPSAVRTRM